ncbi:TIGR03085 family protein [Streptosporangiaceae bacterium NEAU-GS5]|nr:TIGR03085 family protein [Streptosporangiaceae bacterium NEAU-GS5]
MNHAQAERAELSDLLDQLGPDAPTLCEGWTTADLAAHLVLRERSLAAAGITIKMFSGRTRMVQERLKAEHSWPELVDLVRHGPPRSSPFGFIPGADAAVNTFEFLIHHEDVRRAQPEWEPRELPRDLNQLIWRRLTRGARLYVRKSPVGVVLRDTEGHKAGAKLASPAVVVTGEPAELLLFASGRQRASRVTLDGPAEAVASLRTAKLGI